MRYVSIQKTLGDAVNWDCLDDKIVGQIDGGMGPAAVVRIDSASGLCSRDQTRGEIRTDAPKQYEIARQTDGQIGNIAKPAHMRRKS